jgi:hypothetical protein
VALRTIFSKIFLHAETIPLRPKLFDNDERFAELATGHIRIENGWFAIALLPQEVPKSQQRQPVLLRGAQPPARQPALRQPQQSAYRSGTVRAAQPGSDARR